MRTRCLLLLVASYCLAGCATLGVPKSLSFLKKDPLKAKPEIPAQVIAVWSDAVYTEAGRPAVRGFGGRLYFHNASGKAVPVQGQLVIYGYDDSVDGNPARPADRKFVFTAEQLATHLTAGELGVSYTLWVPWEPVGGYRKTVTLLPVFTAANGPALTGQQTVNLLPGKTPEASEQQARRNSTGLRESAVVQPASYQTSTPARGAGENAGDLTAPEGPARRLRATAIPLPVSMQRMIEKAGPQASPTTAGTTGEATPGTREGLWPRLPSALPSEPAANAMSSRVPPDGSPTQAISDPTLAYPGGPNATVDLARPGITAPTAAQTESPPTRFERLRRPAQAAATGR